MVKIIPYLLVSNAKNLIALYTDLFGAKLVSHQPHDLKNPPPFGFPQNFDVLNSTLHAEINIDKAVIYLGDFLESKNNIKDAGNQINLLLELNSQTQIEEIWQKVQDHQFKITMDLQKMFWGAIYGSFIDSEGINWQLNYTLPKSPDSTQTSNIQQKIEKKPNKSKK